MLEIALMCIHLYSLRSLVWEWGQVTDTFTGHMKQVKFWSGWRGKKEKKINPTVNLECEEIMEICLPMQEP